MKLFWCISLLCLLFWNGKISSSINWSFSIKNGVWLVKTLLWISDESTDNIAKFSHVLYFTEGHKWTWLLPEVLPEVRTYLRSITKYHGDKSPARRCIDNTPNQFIDLHSPMHQLILNVRHSKRSELQNPRPDMRPEINTTKRKETLAFFFKRPERKWRRMGGVVDYLISVVN